MNKLVKIVLLIVAIIAAVSGVMAYYKTVVSPPSHMSFKNQYVAAIKNDIAEMKKLSTINELDSAFVAITHEINFMWKDSLLQSKEQDRQNATAPTLSLLNLIGLPMPHNYLLGTLKHTSLRLQS